MKKFAYLFLVVLIFGCSEQKLQVTEQEKKANLDWLLGNWERTNEDPDMQTFENWIKNSESEYLGFGYTLKDSDTVFQEKMEFIENNGNWILHVTMPDDSQATSFKVTEINDTNMICINEKNDFPNKIHYWKEGKILNATISNQEMEMLFVFEKLNK